MTTRAEELRRAGRADCRFALAMVAPAVLVLVATTTFPLLYLLWQSTQSTNLALPGMDRYIGAENFSRLWDDARFWSALGFTVIYTGSTTAAQLVLGLGMALL